jgi:hypothetical protein
MYFNIVFNEFRFHGLFISLSTFNWRHSPKSLSSAETDLVESTTVQQLWVCVTTKKLILDIFSIRPNVQIEAAKGVQGSNHLDLVVVTTSCCNDD